MPVTSNVRSATGKAMKKKSAAKKKPVDWLTKLNSKKEIQIKKIEKAFADIPARSEMLIATPGVFEQYVRRIKKGESRNLKEIRADLAKKFHAGYTCPVTTGIFLRIVAEANYERLSRGEAPEKIAPFWRAIEPGSSLARKLSFGEDFIVEMRKAEGIEDGV